MNNEVFATLFMHGRPLEKDSFLTRLEKSLGRLLKPNKPRKTNNKYGVLTDCPKMNTQDLVKIAKTEDVWVFGNQVLYDLCKSFPNHKTPEEIVAKIWLIGRSYAAAIERRKTKTINNDSFYEKCVVEAVLQSDLDSKLKRLKTFPVINNVTIPEILLVHKFLLDTFKKITGMEKRSLVSKYLHFHFPNLFYIYDSRAVTSLRKFQKSKRVSLPQCEFDKEYATFFVKLYSWQQEIFKKTDVYLTPREMDRILLNCQLEETIPLNQ